MAASAMAASDWQPVTTLGPDFSPELQNLLLSDQHEALLSLLRRRDEEELRTKIKKHLLALGWTIASKPNPGLAPRLRYVSPAGNSYYSLRRVIPDLDAPPPPSHDDDATQSQSQSQFESCGDTDATPVLEEPDDDDHPQEEEDAIAEDVAFMEEQNARRGRGQGNDEERRSMAKELRIKAKDQLRSLGWTFSMKVKYNGREELHYTEKRGRSHNSLITACKAYLQRPPPPPTCSKKKKRAPSAAFKKRKRKKKKASQQARVLRPRPTNEEGSRLNALPPAREPRARTLLSLLIDKKILAPRDKLTYRTKRGLNTGDGMVKCMCGGCNNKRRAEFTVAEFAVHDDIDGASASSRPWARMFVRDGRSLSQCLVQLMMAADDDEADSGRKKKKKYVWRGARVKRKWDDDDDCDYVCSICHDCGELLMCDCCPSMFHHACVGLDSTPQGDWFCPACSCTICGSTDFDDPATNSSSRGGFSFSDKMVIYCDQWQPEEHAKLCMAFDVLHECFVTLIEPRTQTDITGDIVFNTESELRRLDFRGFYVVGVEKAGELITVATLRVYGDKVAERPLVGTRFAHRRQGMCRLLMNELEKLLGEMEVERLVLPAVPELVATWTGSFGFREMGQCDRKELAHHAIVCFQGTTMCHKLLRSPSSTST